MANFSTNQVRQLYVANALKTLSATADPSTVLTANGDIAVVGIEKDQFKLVYKNGDGIITASDNVKVANVEYVKKATAASLAIKLLKSTITIDSANGVGLNDLKEKHVQLILNLREYMGGEFSERYPIVIDVYVGSKEGASATAFYTAIKDELEKALKAFKVKPVTVTSSASGVVITQAPQKWVRGKLQANPVNFEVFTKCGDIAWGAVAVADSGSTITGDYTVADLEYFCYGERGDVLRQGAWPNDYVPTFMVNPVAGTSTYGVVTIQYSYTGKAEDVQKSPKTIQIAAPDAVCTSIETAITKMIEGTPASA